VSAASPAKRRRLQRVCLLNPQGYVAYPPPFGKTDTGGQILYVFQLAQALAKQNLKVDIVTRQFSGLPVEEEVMPGVRIVRIAAGGEEFVEKERMYELADEFTRNTVTYLASKRRRYDVIHSHYWDGGLIGMKLAKRFSIPHIHTPHSFGRLKKIGMEIEKVPPEKLEHIYRFQIRNAVEQRIYNKADALVVICETSRIQLLQHYAVDFEKVRVVYPGVDTKVFRPKPAKADEKIVMKPNAVLTMSRMVPAKGLDRLIDALALLKGKVPFHLYLGGSSHDERQSSEEKQTERKLTRLIKKYGLEKRVTLLGNIPHGPQLAAYYRQADVFVLAGRYEPFGLTTLESMACGTPPIVTSVAGSKEVVVDELNGFIVDTHDRQELAQVIRDLLKHPKKRSKVGDNAAYTITKHFSWDRISPKFVSLYKELQKKHT
jgi:mannosylfructose-phosphate synthase